MNKHKLFDYFEGKATALEIRQIEEWSRDPAHEEQFYDWLDQWERSHLQYDAEKEQSLERYHHFLYNKELFDDKVLKDEIKVDSAKGIYSLGWRTFGLWAVASMILFIAGTFLFHDKLLLKTYTTTYGESRSLILSDGSSVTLNANSSLSVPRFGFREKTREVKLRGEASFSVIHQKGNERFIVKTLNGADVVVLGTEFTVFARPRGTKVTLSRGKVQLRYIDNVDRLTELMMKPGDVVELTKLGLVSKKNIQIVSEAKIEWVNHQHKFNKTPLTEIIAMLSENYGLSIALTDKKAGQLTLSGLYTARNGDELLRIIAEVLNLDVQFSKDKYTLNRRPNL